MKHEFAPMTPGEMLKHEFLIEYGLSQNQLAKAIGISPNRVAEIVNNRRRITADTALRLGLYFGNSPEFWLNLQTHYDLKQARDQLNPEVVARIKRGAPHKFAALRYPTKRHCTSVASGWSSKTASTSASKGGSCFVSPSRFPTIRT